jgi:hypothetical protein
MNTAVNNKGQFCRAVENICQEGFCSECYPYLIVHHPEQVQGINIETKVPKVFQEALNVAVSRS